MKVWFCILETHDIIGAATEAEAQERFFARLTLEDVGAYEVRNPTPAEVEKSRG